MERDHSALDVVNAINRLDHRWHREHSDRDGSEFSVEGLYSPHLADGSRGVPVPFDSLGSTCLTQIAGFVAMVSLPLVPLTPKTGSLRLEPPYLHHRWLREADWSGFVDVTWGWGTAQAMTHGGGQGHVQAFRVAVAPSGGVPPQDVGKSVQQALPGWWRRAVEWLELLSATHVRSVDNFHWSEGSDALYAWTSEDKFALVPGRSWMRSSPRITSAWRDFNPWSSAVQLAGLDQVPPLACTLLMNSLRSFREGEYRTCVADAGTAAEIALGEALRHVKHPPGDRDTLGRIAKNARALIHGLVPAVFKRRMVEVRNSVVHEGLAVDDVTASDVYSLAERVVHAVYPLPEVESAGLLLTPGNRERYRFPGSTQH